MRNRRHSEVNSCMLASVLLCASTGACAFSLENQPQCTLPDDSRTLDVDDISFLQVWDQSMWRRQTPQLNIPVDSWSRDDSNSIDSLALPAMLADAAKEGTALRMLESTHRKYSDQPRKNTERTRPLIQGIDKTMREHKRQRYDSVKRLPHLASLVGRRQVVGSLHSAAGSNSGRERVSGSTWNFPGRGTNDGKVGLLQTKAVEDAEIADREPSEIMKHAEEEITQIVSRAKEQVRLVHAQTKIENRAEKEVAQVVSRAKGQVRQVALQAKRAMAREPQQLMLLDISVDGNLANDTETVNASCCVSDLDDATRQECYDCTITNRILTFGYNFPVLNGLMWWVVILIVAPAFIWCLRCCCEVAPYAVCLTQTLCSITCLGAILAIWLLFVTGVKL